MAIDLNAEARGGDPLQLLKACDDPFAFFSPWIDYELKYEETGSDSD
jgi:hypothetical protein